MKHLLLPCLAAALLSGCATVTLTRADGRTTVDVQNTCWKLFGFLPIGSGDPEAPNVKCCTWFSNKAKNSYNAQMLRDLCEREHARAINVETKYGEEKVLGFIFKRIACNTSAELIKD